MSLLMVETSSKNKRFICIGVSGYSLPLIKVSPEAEVNTGILKKNTIFQKEFELEIALLVDNIEFGSPVIEGDVQAEVLLYRKDKDRFLLKCVMNTGEQNRKFSFKVLVPILKPTSWQSIHINISGVIGAVMQAIPAKLKLANIKRKSTKKIRLRFMGIENPEISKLTWNPIPGIDVIPQKVFGNEIEILLNISTPPLAESKLKFEYPEIFEVSVNFE